MTIALICPDKDPTPWINAFAIQAPNINVEIWPNIKDKNQIHLALCWNQPTGSLLRFPNLKAICSMGAGIDHLLNDNQLPTNIPVTRIIDLDLAKSMFNYLLTAVIDHISALPNYRRQQAEKNWQWTRQRPFNKTKIGILGLGQIGSYCALEFAKLGFIVAGVSESKKQLEKVSSYTSNQIETFLSQADILICLLPLTDKTRGILNIDTFNKMNKGSYLINVARGDHVIDEDLISAINNGQLSGACLDVFKHEPLPNNHPFWQNPNITITPHCSSLTRPRTAAKQIIKNYQLAHEGLPLKNLVDINRQY